MFKQKLIDDINRDITLSDYDECISYIVNRLKSCNWCLTIGQFGSISFPGISDIDLIVVVDPGNFDRNYKTIHDVIAKSPKSKDLFHHGAIVVTEFDYKHIKLFHSVDGLKILFERKSIQIREDIKFGLPQILIWNSFFYKAYFKILNSKKIDLRYALLIINNLAYGIDYYERLANNLSMSLYKEKADALRHRALEGKVRILDIFDIIKRGIQTLENLENVLFKNQDYQTGVTQKIIRLNKVYLMSNSISYTKIIRLHIYKLHPIYFKFWDIMKNCKSEYNYQDEKDKIIRSIKVYINYLNKFLKESRISYKEILKKCYSVPLMDMKNFPPC